MSEFSRTDRRLPARYAGVVMPLILSILMTLVVSGVATLKNKGIDEHFLDAWMGAWGVSWVIAFPALLLVLPIVRRLVGLLVAPQA